MIVNSVQTDVQPPQANTTPQGPSATARLDVTVPAKAAAGSNKLTVTATTGGLDGRRRDRDQDRDQRGREADAHHGRAGSRRGPSGLSYTFNLNLSNDTSEDLTFAAEGTGPTGWTVDATLAGQSNAVSAVVKAGASSGITVTAKPPDDVTAGRVPGQAHA